MVSQVPLVTITDASQIVDQLNKLTIEFNALLGTSTGGVSSFTGDGVLLNNSASTGAVTAVQANVAANSILGNFTASSAKPTFGTADSVNALLGINSLTPQGRASLSSTNPVMQADVTAATTIYYLPYNGVILPIWDGANFVNQIIPSNFNIALNATNHPNNQVFDVYASLQAGIPTLSAMYWGSNSSRSTTAGGKTGTGNASIVQKNGLWVNNAAILATDSFNGTTGVAIPQNQGILLFSFYTTAAGQTSMQFTPAAGLGGSNTMLGLSNIYNTIPIKSQSLDSTTSWTYATNTWQASDASNSNRITYLDSLGQYSVEAILVETIQPNASTGNGQIGINFNSATATPNMISRYVGSQGSNNIQTHPALANFQATMGLNYVQAMEISISGTTTFFGGTGHSMCLEINLSM